MSVDLLQELRRPLRWAGQARDLRTECWKEIRDLREVNAGLRAEVADLTATLKEMRSKRAKRQTKKAA
jgi:hypothetical protein